MIQSTKLTKGISDNYTAFILLFITFITFITNSYGKCEPTKYGRSQPSSGPQKSIPIPNHLLVIGKFENFQVFLCILYLKKNTKKIMTASIFVQFYSFFTNFVKNHILYFAYFKINLGWSKNGLNGQKMKKNSKKQQKILSFDNFLTILPPPLIFLLTILLLFLNFRRIQWYQYENRSKIERLGAFFVKKIKKHKF